MRTSLPSAIFVWPLSLGVLSFCVFVVNCSEAQTHTAVIDDVEAKPQTAPPIADNALDSKAQTYVRRLPKKSALPISTETTNLNSSTSSAYSQANSGGVQRLEEIRVVDAVAPEDYVAPKTSPMLVFRASLNRQRPMTPKEITQTALCFIGLCQIDTSRELSVADRNEFRAKDPPSFAAPDSH